MTIYQTYKYGFVSESVAPTEETGTSIFVQYSNQGTDEFEYTQPWDYSLGTADNHAAAAEEAIKHWNSIYDNYFGDVSYIQGLLPDGRYAYMQVPVCLKYDDGVLPLNSTISNPVLPKPLDLKPGMVLRNKSTDHKFVVTAVKIQTFKYVDTVYEIVCEKPHEDGDFSYLCYSNYCRCAE